MGLFDKPQPKKPAPSKGKALSDAWDFAAELDAKDKKKKKAFGIKY